MHLWFALILIIAAYSVVHFMFVPTLDKQWQAASTINKYAKAGTLVALKTLEDFLKIALVVFSISFFLFSFLSIAAPVFGATVLETSYNLVALVVAMLAPLQSFIGVVTLWIALIAIFWAAWRIHRTGLIEALNVERQRQINVLLTENGGFEELPATEEMQRVALNIATCESVIAELAEAGGQEARDKLKQLEELHDTLVAQYAFLDVDRRIDLSKVAVEEGVDRSGSVLSRLRVGLFSKGMQQTLSWSAKAVKRAGAVAACFLVIGVSAPALARSGAIPLLGSINEIQVYRLQNEAQASLKLIAKIAATKPNSQKLEKNNEPESAVYHNAALYFAHALVTSTDWRTAVGRVDPTVAAKSVTAHKADRVVEEIAIRDELLRDFTANATERAAPIRGVSFADEVAMPASARNQYGEFREFIARQSISPAPEPVVGRIERWIRAKAAVSPAFKQRLTAGVASFREPATLADMFGNVLDDALSGVIDEALPNPTDAGLFGEKGVKAARKGLRDPAARMIQAKLAAFLNDIEAGQNFATSIERVRKGEKVPAFFTRNEAALAQARLAEGEESLTRITATATELHPSLQLNEAPANVRRTEAVLRVLHPMTSNGDAMRSAVEGSMGTYEDLFPGRAQAVNESALGRAISKVYGSAAELPDAIANAASTAFDAISGAGGGGGAKSEAFSARSFARLRGSVRVGGVLIGAEPSAGNSLNVRDIFWSVDGQELKISLKIGNSDVEIGTFTGETVQQALAYAADARPTAVTMTSGPLMPRILRVHIHPALVDTALGCNLMELDRFVDTATSTWKERDLWTERVETQLSIYNSAVGEEHALDIFDDMQPALFAAATLRAFPESWHATDQTVSIFAHDPQRFDQTFVDRLKQCRLEVAAGRDRYLACVHTKPIDAKRYSPQPFAIWSGVREADFPLTLVNLRQPTGVVSNRSMLRFMLQVAFEREDACDDESCTETAPTAPWEFPIIARGISDRTFALIRGNQSAQAIFIRAQQFTTLQRLFRAALAGRLGEDFPRQKLIVLMRDAARADPIDTVSTPNWNQPRELAQQIFMLARVKAASKEATLLSRARQEFMASVLDRKNGERFSGNETCRGGSLTIH